MLGDCRVRLLLEVCLAFVGWHVDPSFALAYAELALVEGVRSAIDPAAEARYQAAIRKALELGPELPETHFARAWHLWWRESRFRDALATAAHASALRPGDAELLSWLATFQIATGQTSEGFANIERTLRRGVEFLLSYKLERGRYPTATEPSYLWRQLSFPLFYQADVLFVLRAIDAAGAIEDPRTGPAIAWLLANLIDLGASNAFSILGGAGPALSGLIVSAVRRPESSGVPAGRRLRLFCITGLLIMVLLVVRRLWFAQALVSIVGRPNRLLAYRGIMAFLADLLAAGVLALFFSGVDSPLQGVRDYLRSLDPRRQPVRWYWCLAAAGLYPAIVLLGNLIWSAFGLPLPAPQAGGAPVTLDELEAEHIRRVLASTATLEEASARLGIDPSTLYRKRKRYGI